MFVSCHLCCVCHKHVCLLLSERQANSRCPPSLSYKVNRACVVILFDYKPFAIAFLLSILTTSADYQFLPAALTGSAYYHLRADVHHTLPARGKWPVFSNVLRTKTLRQQSLTALTDFPQALTDFSQFPVKP